MSILVKKKDILLPPITSSKKDSLYHGYYHKKLEVFSDNTMKKFFNSDVPVGRDKNSREAYFYPPNLIYPPGPKNPCFLLTFLLQKVSQICTSYNKPTHHDVRHPVWRPALWPERAFGGGGEARGVGGTGLFVPWHQGKIFLIFLYFDIFFPQTYTIIMFLVTECHFTHLCQVLRRWWDFLSIFTNFESNLREAATLAEISFSKIFFPIYACN